MISSAHGLVDPGRIEAQGQGRPEGAAQPSDAGTAAMDWLQDGRQIDDGVSTATLSEGDDATLLRLGRFRFKRAETDAELEQVHRLNYETFVREVAQYDDAGTDRLV